MFGRSIGVVASIAVSAGALVLPPRVLPEDYRSLSIYVGPTNRLLRIPCPACVLPSVETEKAEGLDEEGYVWIQGGANEVILNFTITDDRGRLMFDSQQIYPFAAIPFIPTYVTQVSSSSSNADVVAGTARHAPLEVSIQHMSSGPKESVSEWDDVLIPITLHIAALEHKQMVLDEVSISLLQLSTGELWIHGLESTPLPEAFKPPFGSDTTADETHGHHCRWLPASLCRIKDTLKMDLESMRPAHFSKPGGCRGRKGVNPSSEAEQEGERLEEGEEDRPRHHQGRPHHMRPHGRHHRHHRHGLFHMFAKRLIAVLVPIIAGITVGLTVSLLGQLIGRLIGYVWTRFVRGDQRGYASLALEDTEAQGEEAALPPPKYEEAPAYEENEKILTTTSEEEGCS